MKKNTIKAFTLVEMLIVIVIIGILIASLMPRMQSAQGRARDVARKNDLSQIQTAIITSQSDRGGWPGTPANTGTATSGSTTTAATGGIVISQIGKSLLDAGMTNIPQDPNGSNDNYGIGTSKNAAGADINAGEYLYMVGKRNGVADAGFALMAKTEVEGGSNWVVCAVSNDNQKDLTGGYIKSTDDLAKVQLCSTVSKCDTDNCCQSNQADCKYRETGELRYLLVY